MGSRIFGRNKGEQAPSSRSTKVGAGLGALLLVGVSAGVGGFWLGNENGHSNGVEDCNDSFGPDRMISVGKGHPLDSTEVAAMVRLAKTDADPVSFHTSSTDLESVGLGPILEDLDKGRVIRVSIPEEVMLSSDSKGAIKDALTVGNILKSWADNSDSIVKLTPEGTQREVDPGTEVVVEIQNFNC